MRIEILKLHPTVQQYVRIRTLCTFLYIELIAIVYTMVLDSSSKLFLLGLLLFTTAQVSAVTGQQGMPEIVDLL